MNTASCAARSPRFAPFYWDIVKAARDEPERGWGKNYQNHIAKIQKATKVPSPRGARCAEIPRRLVFVLVRIGGNKVTFPLSFFLDFDMF